MSEISSRFSARNRLNHQQDDPTVSNHNDTEPPLQNAPAGRLYNSGNHSINKNYGERKNCVSPEEMRKRKKEETLKMVKELIEKKDIYEFTDKEKELYIQFHPELFCHNEDEIGNAEFITNSPTAELVLSDYFVKKEDTEEKDFQLNFHSSVADEVLG